jgi:hypothetical protein
VRQSEASRREGQGRISLAGYYGVDEDAGCTRWKQGGAAGRSAEWWPGAPAELFRALWHADHVPGEDRLVEEL